MKLYDDNAPNPRRVRIFLAEKGIEVERVPVSIMEKAHKSPEYRAKNPMMGVPVLELDDGTCIAESVAICRYFEVLHPEPPLFGKGPVGEAQVEMWNRRMELNLFFPVAMYFRHALPFMAELETQVADWGSLNRDRAAKVLDWLDRELASRPFIAGAGYSIADITAICAVDFARMSRLKPLDGRDHLKRWYDMMHERPSTKA